jgi:hypothetical protein
MANGTEPTPKEVFYSVIEYMDRAWEETLERYDDLHAQRVHHAGLLAGLVNPDRRTGN